MTATPSPSPTPGAKPGAIILARHGEPALSRKVKLTADGYREFWAKYEVGGLLPNQTPPDRLKTFINRAGAFVSSTRLRAIQSAEAAGAGRDFARHEILIEAPLPPPNFPAWLKLSPKIWGFLARVWWWYLDHHEGQETRAQAEARADRAADMLMVLAADGADVVVLAHGFFNHLIGRSLRKRGWNLVESEGYRYWSIRKFQIGWN